MKTMMLRLIASSLLLFVKVSKSEFRYETPHHGKIVNGFLANIENYPYQVSLQAPQHFCGGSIISETFILTAAHCASVAEAEDVKVRSGSSYWDNGGTLSNVKFILVHPYFSKNTLSYDFALFELDDVLNFSELIQPVKLVGRNYKILAGNFVTVSGYGETLNPLQFDRRLRAVRLPIVGKQRCNKTYTFLGGITDQMICAGFQGGGKDSCFGDSGGPMVDANGFLLGVVSWGFEGCAVPHYPGVYARVSSVRDWINELANV